MFALLTQLQFAKKLRQTDPAKLYSWYYDALPGKIIIFYVMTYGTICVFLSEGQIVRNNLVVDLRILEIYTIQYIFLLFSTKNDFNTKM